MRLYPLGFMYYYNRCAVEKVFPAARVAAPCDVVEMFSFSNSVGEKRLSYLPCV
jgi:hypothetical protein